MDNSLENLNLNEILGSLSAADMDMLKNAAASILGGGNEEKPKEPPTLPQTAQNPLGIGAEDFQMMMKAKSIFDKMNSASNKNTDLILALKPHLSPENQEKADSAIRLLRLFEILPLLKDMF